MQPDSPQTISTIIVITTLLLLVLCSIVIRYIFMYQQRRYGHLQEINELRKELLQSQVEVYEQTLDNVAKELHANIGQLASLININLSAILSQTAEPVTEQVMDTKTLAKQLLAELKVLSTGLNIDYIKQIGFYKALKLELERLAKTKNYEIIFNTAGEVASLPQDHDFILFRLSQEVLNNILKYSQASVINVSLAYSDTLSVELSDNGIGFDVEEALKRSAENGSTGIINIRKRVKMMGGEVAIDSGPAQGTKYTITLPVKKNQLI